MLSHVMNRVQHDSYCTVSYGLACRWQKMLEILSNNATLILSHNCIMIAHSLANRSIICAV